MSIILLFLLCVLTGIAQHAPPCGRGQGAHTVGPHSHPGSSALLGESFTFPAQAGAAELSPEEAVNAFLKTLDREQVLPLPPAASQGHSFLQPSVTQDQRTNLSLHPLTTGLSFLHPRTLTHSIDTVNSYLLTTTVRQNQPTYVGYAQINKVAVTDLKRISENEYKAEFMLGYTVGPFGSLLFGRSVQFQRPQDALLDYQDNGWRVKFIKTF